LIASPVLSEADVCAIREGYENRNKIIKLAVLRSLEEPDNNEVRDRLNFLANLIAAEIIDIKIAYTSEKTNMGIYHEKLGLICDKEGNKVAFTGSLNESYTALRLNYESIDVFCSWNDHDERVKLKEDAFNRIWNAEDKNIQIVDFPELKKSIIDKYKRSSIEWDIDDKVYLQTDLHLHNNELELNKFVIPIGVTLHEYQNDAIEEWVKNGYKGIFDMATGTGKTFTGLGAIARLNQEQNEKLFVLIVCPYQHLVEQWVEDIVNFGVTPIIGYSASPQRHWKLDLKNSIRDQKIGIDKKNMICLICTNATFSSNFIQSQISKIRAKKLIIVDEAHNFGSGQLSQKLNKNYDYRLALSATIERHRDEEGTQKLYDFFGKKCIVYDLERAIQEDKLTPYKYYPIIISFSDEELSEYERLSYEISKCYINTSDGKMKLSKWGEMLALERARLVAGAIEKISMLKKIMTSFVNDNHMLVYCGATRILEDGEDSTAVEDEDIRQIDAVTKILGDSFKMKVSQFTSKENIHERTVLKKEFAEGKTIQVLIAIKCLDEGVNIPEIKRAFILASTTNPKEYIQRRGRVLRKSFGKDYAEIYDFITLPYPLNDVSSLTQMQLERVQTLVKNEVRRAEEFSKLASNMAQSQTEIDQIKEIYSLSEY
jgi:superfamily II DNA or RNA helicase